MTRLDRWHEAPAAPARRGVHIWGALRTPSAAAAASGHLDQIGGTRGVPGGGSSGGSRLRATRRPGGNSSVCRRSAHSSFRCWLVGSTSAHVPRGVVAHKAMAAVPGVRTAWEERAPRHLRQGPRLGGKLGLSVGGTPAPDLAAPPVANAPDFPGRRGSVPGLPSPGTVSMDVAV